MGITDTPVQHQLSKRKSSSCCEMGIARAAVRWDQQQQLSDKEGKIKKE
jgi:hypothetical protein